MNTINRSTRAALAAITLLAASLTLAPHAASAQAPTPAPPPADTTGSAASNALAARAGTITYSGETLFRIRTAAGGYTAEQRAEAIRERLVPILSLENLKPEEVTIRQSRPFQDAAIYVRDQLLVTVDRVMAQSNGDKDPGDLARAWADHLRHVLPSLSVTPDDNPFRAPDQK